MRIFLRNKVEKFEFVNVHFEKVAASSKPSEPQDITGQSGTPVPSGTPASQTAASFKEGANISLKAGKTETLTVENGTVKEWKSSKKKVATVKDGKVTALKKGTAVITAVLSDGTTLTCTVKVTSSPAIKVVGKKFNTKKTYVVKKNKTIKVKITGKAAGVKNVYVSSKKKVAKVTSKNTADTVKIKGLKKGRAKISITVNGVKFTIKVKVK